MHCTCTMFKRVNSLNFNISTSILAVWHSSSLFLILGSCPFFFIQKCPCKQVPPSSWMLPAPLNLNEHRQGNVFQTFNFTCDVRSVKISEMIRSRALSKKKNPGYEVGWSLDQKSRSHRLYIVYLKIKWVKMS